MNTELEKITDSSEDGYLAYCRALATSYKLRGIDGSGAAIKDSPWTMYEDKALLVLAYTGNSNAYFEGMTGAEQPKNTGEVLCMLAGYALAADVRSALKQLEQEILESKTNEN